MNAHTERLECPTIAIYFGTVHASVAISKHGEVEVMPSDFTKHLEYNDQEIQHIKNLLFPKRHIKTVVNEETMTLSPKETLSMYLDKVKETSEIYLGKKVKNVVFSVPAYFTPDERTELKEAAKISGLNIIRYIREPEAAAVAYGLDKKNAGNFVVFHLRDASLDVTIMSREEGTFEVLSMVEPFFVGGKDIDEKLLLKQIEKALDYAFLKKNDIDEIILVGESTHISNVQQLTKEFFNGKGPIISANPDEAVVYGTSILEGRISCDADEGTNEERRRYDTSL